MVSNTFPRAAVLTIWTCWLLIILPRMIIPPLLPLIEKDLSLSHEEAALLMSAYMFPYALMQIPAGSLSDRFGKKYFIFLSVFGTCLVTILMTFAKSFESLLMLRMISGLVAGLYYAPSTAYVFQSADSKDVGMVLGLAFTGGSFSNIVITVLVNFLPVAEHGWRIFFLLSAIPGALFAPFLLFLLRGEKGRLRTSREGLDVKSFWRGLKSLQLILVLVYNLTSSLSMWSFTTFLPTFYVLERGFTVSEASLLMMIYYAASMVSGPFSGFVTNVLGFRVPGLIAAAAMCVVSYTIPLSRLWFTTILVLMLWALLGGLSWIAYNALISELVPKGLQGTFLGVFNLVGFLSGTIGPPIFGRIADIAGFEAFFQFSLLLSIIPLAMSILIIRFFRFGPRLEKRD